MLYSFGGATLSKALGHRQPNQDAFWCNQENGLCIVVDGMGGHDHGDLAAQRAIEVISNTCSTPRPNRIKLAIAFALANQAIVEDGKNDQTARACVASVVWVNVNDPKADFHAIHVGDTRISRITFVDGKWKKKRITRYDNNPDTDRITVWLGMPGFEAKYADKISGKFVPGEMLALESDGMEQLHPMWQFQPNYHMDILPDKTISPLRRVSKLLRMFNEHNSNFDDASIVLIQRNET